METYCLFLDESKLYGKLKYFCLGGCIIKEIIYTKQIIPIVQDLKRDIFGSTDVILHECEIRDADKEPFNILKGNDKKKQEFWNGLRKVFDKTYITTIGCGVEIKEYQKNYNNTYANNEYFVSLQIILENFVHFLENCDGRGVVYIEGQNPTYNKKLQSLFHTIMANGTLFINKGAFQNRLTTINFFIKQDDCIGLQLADFVPSVFNRKYSGSKVKMPTIIDLIEYNLYDGNIGMTEKFGFKIIS